MPRGDGPFQVLERINDNAFEIDFPPKYQVHNTFNVCDISLFDMIEDDYPLNLRSNYPQDGEDYTILIRSKTFTKSQARIFKGSKDCS